MTDVKFCKLFLYLLYWKVPLGFSFYCYVSDVAHLLVTNDFKMEAQDDVSENMFDQETKHLEGIVTIVYYHLGAGIVLL